ncbi:hypothetical protein JY471_02420 [Stenotrophomonas maltophilia]|nr:hypothetical protein [Stenotrophomonas maltophilia]MBN5141377.1 hypothetical protein [Stenotrophomonas maltophilia]WQI19465.1 hypothetical protein U2S91_15115 [Stenotrophomonas maltophilia]
MLLKKLRQKTSKQSVGTSSGALGTQDTLILSLKSVPSVSPLHWLKNRSVERRVRMTGVAEIVEAPVIRSK